MYSVIPLTVTGVPNFHNLSEVKNNAARICKATHVDPRCVAASVMVASVVALMLQVCTFNILLRPSNRSVVINILIYLLSKRHCI